MASAAGPVHRCCDARNDAGRNPALREDGRVARRGAASPVHARSLSLHPGNRAAEAVNWHVPASGARRGTHLARADGEGALLRRGTAPISSSKVHYLPSASSTLTPSRAQSSLVRHSVLLIRDPVNASSWMQYLVWPCGAVFFAVDSAAAAGAAPRTRLRTINFATLCMVFLPLAGRLL